MRYLILGGLLLGASATAQNVTPTDLDALPHSAPTLSSSYGKAAEQLGDLRLPAGKGPFPVAVVIHGGCFTKGFATRANTAALSTVLAARGIATWNIEYRQVGDPGGGWPGSFLDWGAATDHLRVLAKSSPLDLSRVVVVGHSAGALAALWIAARDKLPATSAIRVARPLPVKAAIGIDGPPDLAPFIGVDAGVCGKPVIVPLMGGTPAEQPARYVEGSPARLLPIKPQQYLVASVVIPPADAEAYRAAAAAKGNTVKVTALVDAGHFDMMSPATPSGKQIVELVVAALN